ncbi:MAG: GumC family protein [Candidatus Scalindua sp.]
MSERKINFVEILSALIEWRKFIVINFVVICFITAIFTLVAPKTFTANSTILTPVDSGGQFNLSSLMSNLPLGGLGLGPTSEQINLYMAILNSRQLMEKVAKKFKLMERYNADDLEATVRTLRERVSINLNDDGSLSLSVSVNTRFLPTEQEENEARKLSAEITNYFVEELDQKYRKLKNERAHTNRVFLENRYVENLKDLQQAELGFKEFQDKYGLIALDEQTHAAITAMSELKARIITKEVQVGMLSKYVQKSHFELLKAKTELDQLKKKYQDIMASKDKATDSGNGRRPNDFMIAFDELPELGLQYARLFREVKLQEKLQEFLLPLYEQAKIEEAQNSATVQILDKAVPPVKRTSPKRTITVLLMGFLSLIFSFIWINVAEYFNSLKSNEEDYHKWNQIRSHLHSDIRKIFKRRK